MAVLSKKFLAAATLLLVSTMAGAQAAPAKPTCDVAESATGNAARATLSVNLAREAAAPAVAVTNLKNAIKLLDHVEKGDNPVTDAYVLGMALSLMANQPNMGLTMNRGAIGFTTNPTATLDLPTTLDSLFKIVEAAKPICSDYTSYWRAGQKFYIDVVNGAINALNADKLDSAEYYAKQANTLYPRSPYGVYVLGGVAAKRNDEPKSIEYWNQAATVAARDSNYRDIERQVLVSLGIVYMNKANAASGAEKVDAARKAANIYAQLLAVPGSRGLYISGGRQNLQNAYLLMGDTVSAAKSWEPLAANPEKYDYQDLLNSAVNASRANRSADAGKLFEGVLVQNPYNRDALYNVAVTYLTLDQNEKVGPIVTRLIAVDPGNPDNYNLAARAYLAMAKSAEKAKKSALSAAYNDTTVNWYNAGNKLPAEVVFREFSPTEKQVSVAGTVTDRRDKADANSTEPTPAPAPAAKPVKGKPAPKAAAPKKPEAKEYPPKPVILNFSMLDKTGQVVGTETVTTEPLAPGQSAKFNITVKAPGVVAYRYTFSN